MYTKKKSKPEKKIPIDKILTLGLFTVVHIVSLACMIMENFECRLGFGLFSEDCKQQPQLKQGHDEVNALQRSVSSSSA